MIRNFLFSIFFYIGIIFICIIYLPALVLPYKVTLTGGRLMGYWAKFCLTFFSPINLLVAYLLSIAFSIPRADK